MQRDDLALALGVVGSAKHRALRNVAAKPHSPAIDLIGRWPIEDDAFCEALIMLQKEHHGLVEVLLPEGKPKVLQRAAQNHTALLYERALVYISCTWFIIIPYCPMSSARSFATSLALSSRQSSGGVSSERRTAAAR